MTPLDSDRVRNSHEDAGEEAHHPGLTRGPRKSTTNPRVEVKRTAIGEVGPGLLATSRHVPPGLRPTTPNDRIGHSIPNLEKRGYIPTMPYSRIIPTLVIAWLIPQVTHGQAPNPAQPPTTPATAQAFAPVSPPANDPAVLAGNVLDTTAIQLRLRPRIAATIVQKVDMLNQKFRLEGNYYKDTGNRVRLQLDLVGLGDLGSTMLQVCDGKVLWEFRKVLGIQDYRRRDLVPILQRLENPALDDFFRSLVMTQLGFGGPEALVMGFQKSVKFDKFSDKTVEGMDCWVLEGAWRDRAGLTSPNEPPLNPTIPLPPYIPSNVTITIEKKTFWPFLIEMVGNPVPLISEDVRQYDPVTNKPIGPKKPAPKVDPSKIILRYTLLPDTEIKPEVNFAFSAPKDAPNFLDDTEPFLVALDGMIEGEIKRKKSEAASKGEDDQRILKVNPLEAPGTVVPPTTPPGGGSGSGSVSGSIPVSPPR